MKAKSPFLFLFLCIAAWHAAAQITFQRTYGIGLYNEGRCVKQTYDGGYIIAGTASDAGAGSSDFYLLKVDSLGNFQWHKVYGGGNIEKGYAVEQLADSGFAIGGYTNSFGANMDYDAYLVRTDKSGDTLWTKTYGSSDWDFTVAMRQAPGGGFILAGNSYSDPTGNSEPLLIKTDQSGNPLWMKMVDLHDDAFINTVQLTPGGNMLLGGYLHNSSTGNDEALLIKCASDGDTIWTKTFRGPGGSMRINALDIYPADSSILIAGYLVDTTSGHVLSYYSKLDASGDTSYVNIFSGTGDDELTDAHFYADSILVTGFTTTFAFGGKDTRYLLFNAFQGYLGGGTHGGSDDDIAYHMEATRDGGYILCGSSTSYSPGLQSVYLVKLDGTFTTDSLKIGLEELSKKVVIGVHPDPMHDFTEFDFSETNPVRADLSVYNSFGEKVFAASGKKRKLYFYRNDLAAGVYFYRVTMEDGKNYSGRFIIE